MKQEAFEEQALLYLFHSLDDQESKAFESYLEKANQAQLDFFNDMRTTSMKLATATEIQTPRSVVKRQLLEAIEAFENPADVQETSEAKEEPIVETKPIATPPVAETPVVHTTTSDSAPGFVDQLYALLKLDQPIVAFGAVGALSAILLVLIVSQIQLSSEFNTLQAEYDTFSKDAQKNIELVEFMEKSATNVAVLKATKDAKEAISGAFYYDEKSGQALVEFNNLSEAPDQKAYQLWAIIDKKPTSLGVFKIDSQKGAKFFKLDQVIFKKAQEAQMIALTMEPEGGSPQPTGKILIAGSF